MTAPIPGDGARLGFRYFPMPDALTAQEYHRLMPAEPAPPGARIPRRSLVCPACGQPFEPHSLAGRPRFCSPECRRWFHYGPGCRDRKAATA